MLRVCILTSIFQLCIDLCSGYCNFQGALKFWLPLVIVERGHLIIFSLCAVFQPDEFIQVHFLETSEDHGILDPDDVLSDVVDDKDKVLIVPTFEISYFMSTLFFFLDITRALD